MFEKKVTWILGAANADTYGTDGLGTGTATASSALAGFINMKEVEILQVDITTAAGVNVSVIWHNGTSAAVIPGMTWSAAAIRTITLPPGTIFRDPTAGAALDHVNLGIRLGAGAVATLYFRKIA